jgi:cysteine-rich repeat protein
MLLHSAKTRGLSISKMWMAGFQFRYIDVDFLSVRLFKISSSYPTRHCLYSSVFKIVNKSILSQLTPFQSMENAPEEEGYCGDGIVQIPNGEECDDGNRVVTDSCVSKCPLLCEP